MKNLDQIRAKNALEATQDTRFSGANNGEVAKKVPTMIMENGLIAAAAFAIETGKGYEGVFNAIIAHLHTVACLPGTGKMKLNGFVEDLCNSDSSTLRKVTAETMAYLSYLRRFAKKGD